VDLVGRKDYPIDYSRWRVDPGRFHIRPGLHVHSLHLRRKANQSSVINSVYDIISNGDINLLAREDGFVTILLSASKKQKCQSTLTA
jgi:hypothetical protein